MLRAVIWVILILTRSSHWRCFIKKRLLENLAKFTEKHLWRVSLLKKRLRHRCFPVNFAKFSGTPFLQNTSARLLLLNSKFWKLLKFWYIVIRKWFVLHNPVFNNCCHVKVSFSIVVGIFSYERFLSFEWEWSFRR